jgi:sugar lactone lactonase YvrE
MLYRKNIVSTRTLLQLTAAITILASGVGSAPAATNTGVAPLLVPYVIQSIAGNTQPLSASPTTAAVSGYGGDGQLAITSTQLPSAPAVNTSTFNGPQMVAVDSAGNVYIGDTGNSVIREINKNSGIITTVAGVPPSSCTGTSCAKFNNGCTDAAPATGAKIGNGVRGLAVDGYGNVYFSDVQTQTISVVYRGGTQVANFIALVNPAGVKATNGVQEGYLYHIAGSVNLQTCVAAATKNNDDLPAFADTSQSSYVAAVPTATPPTASNYASLNMSNTASHIGVDSAGNIYVVDIGNGVIRVINAQSTPQIFFNSLVKPGYMASIINCSAYTITCPAAITTTTGTGINGPADQVAFTTIVGTSVDAYGNVYEINYKSASPGIYAGVAYAGGAALAQLQKVEWGITASYGNFYEVINNVAINTSLPNVYEGVIANCCGAASGGGGVAIRPNSIVDDPNGTIWFWDEHYPSIFRIDAQNAIATTLIGWGGTQQFQPLSGAYFMRYEYGVSNPQAFATFTKPQYCIFGTQANPFTQGPTTYDRFGDNCPAVIGDVNESESGIVISDGPGNLFFADTNNYLIREFPLNNVFPASAAAAGETSVPVGSSLTQPIQVHFDSSNNPVPVGALPNLFTNAFSINSPDFSIDTTDPEFQLGTIGWYGWAYTQGGSTNSFADNSSPLSTTIPYGNNGTISMYAGIPSCFEFGLPSNNQSMDCLVYVTFKPSAPGLRRAQLTTATANGSVYYFPLYGFATGGQLAIDGGQQVVISTTGLGGTVKNAHVGPTAVAVTTSGTTYIADPANNRIVVEPAGGGAQTAIGPAINVMAPIATPLGLPAITAATVNTPVASTLSGPMGVAVDAANNVYISDTGNNRILQYNPGSQVATIIGLTLWQSCTNPAASSLTATAPGTPPALIPPNNNASASTAGAGSVSGCTAAGTTVAAWPNGPVYNYNGPEGLAVDNFGNVYVADTGNGNVVEIPSNPVLGGSIPLLNYPGAPALTAPVAVAVGPYYVQSSNTFYQNYIYIADPQNPSGYVVVLPPGGGDLQPTTVPGGTLPGTTVPGLGLAGLGQNIGAPNGVAVDGGGNVYISDSLNNQVLEVPAGGQVVGPQFALSYVGLSTPGGLAVDANGNVYVADAGNNRIVQDFRQSPVVQFGTVAEDLASASGIAGTPLIGGQPCPVAGNNTPCTGVLTLTNIGTAPVAITEPIATVSGVASPVFNISSTTCGTTLGAGATCTISPKFTPTGTVAYMETVNLNGGPQSVALVANGASPLVNIALNVAYSPGSVPATGSIATVTATVTQTHPVLTPTGTVTFNYTIDANTVNAGLCGAGGSSGPITLVAGVASYALPALLQGRDYSVTATYNGDSNDSPTVSSALSINVPGVPVTAISPSYSFLYGATPPNLNAAGGGESVTGILPADQSTVTYTFYSAASTTSGVTAPTNPLVPPYPINVQFTGGNFCNYGFPTVMTAASGGVQSTVTEGPIALNVGFSGTYSTLYGAPPLNFASLLTLKLPSGAAPPNNDAKKFLATFLATNGPPVTISSSNSSTLPVGTYTVTPTLTASNAALVLNYIITTKPGTVTVSQAPSIIATTSAATSETPAKVSSATYANTVTTAVGGGTGIPTGIITIYDSFIPITFPATGTTGTALGLGTPVPSCTLPFLGAITNGSPTVTGVASVYGLAPGEAISGPGIPANTTILVVGAGGILTLSANATATSATELITSTSIATTCTSPLGTITLAPASGGGSAATYTPSASTAPLNQLGTNQLVFAYSGDGNFLPYVQVVSTVASANCVPNNLTISGSVTPSTCLLIDNPDFYISVPYANQGLTYITPGYVPNPNSTSSAQTWPLSVSSLTGETGSVSFSCLPIGNPFSNPVVPPPNGATTTLTSASYIQCQLAPNPSVALSSGSVVTSVLSVSTPASEPLGFNFYSMVPTKGTATMLAFLPLGIFAFCLRRRRRLSKALWMLLAIAVVSVGMSGCGGNTVSFYAPIPIGPQYVTVYASGTSTGTTTTLLRSLTVEIDIQ